MLATVSKEVHLCDNCNEESYPYTCRRCGKEYCWQCAEKLGTQYRHGVYMQGSGDGFYCTPCDTLLCETKNNPLHQAYFAIKQLRDERAAFDQEFESRKEVAEQHLKSLLKVKRL